MNIHISNMEYMFKALGRDLFFATIEQLYKYSQERTPHILVPIEGSEAMVQLQLERHDAEELVYGFLSTVN